MQLVHDGFFGRNADSRHPVGNRMEHNYDIGAAL
jgi:hypothetical protein